MSNTEMVKGFRNKDIFENVFEDKRTKRRYNAMWNGEIGIFSCDDDSGDSDFNIAPEVFDKDYIRIEH